MCFTLNGNMMCRTGPAAYEPALKWKHVREMDFAKRPMKGYIFVTGAGLAEDEDLRAWIDACRAFVGDMPMKVPKVKPK